MQTTARAIITRALRLLKVIAANEAGDAADLDTGLIGLNDLVDSWVLNTNNVLANTQETFPLVSGQADYTIGTGGDLNTAIPIFMQESSFIRLSGVDFPLKSISEDEYSQIPFKFSGGIPYAYWFERGVALATIHFYPVPTVNQTFHMHSTKAFQSFAGLDVVYDLPPGYKEALCFDLAVNIAPEFETEAPKFVIAKSMSLKRSLKRSNVVVPTMSLDFLPADTGGFNGVYGGGSGADAIVTTDGDFILQVPTP